MIFKKSGPWCVVGAGKHLQLWRVCDQALLTLWTWLTACCRAYTPRHVVVRSLCTLRRTRATR